MMKNIFSVSTNSQLLSVSLSGEEQRELLKVRARQLAEPPQRLESAEGEFEVVELSLAQERYAIEQRCVREVYPFTNLTLLPSAPSFVTGIMNVRGQILPVIDIKKFFDLPEQGITDLHRVLIVHHKKIELGILADAVIGTKKISAATLQRSLPTLHGIREEYLKGITADHVVVLDVEKILLDPKLVVSDDGDEAK